MSPEKPHGCWLGKGRSQKRRLRRARRKVEGSGGSAGKMRLEDLGAELKSLLNHRVSSGDGRGEEGT